ncbi:acetate/propionate family kinase [Mycoplasma sp. 1654_15]|uniref:acetate/propionate family kinase n=1 Tax=Mycoplasma sp. 1654_15 TaxID=2725994 RepID=UPI001449D9DD|nr:acetate/propionate family kinase [Mycoplasma sp. 1654_15]QJB71294.1 acetate/propionate family kinase [Mycoplasma sp. 1654_15]
MKNKILVINAGSSSIKWSMFLKETMELHSSGIVERIGIAGSFFKTKLGNQSWLKEQEVKNHKESMTVLIKIWLQNAIIKDVNEIEIAGFRVVHGGSEFNGPTALTTKEINIIEKLSKFAPLHNPGAVQTMKAIQEILPKVKISANFDTAFHTSIPAVNHTYPIDLKFAKEHGIKKYGFHGISHRYITNKMEEIFNKDKVNFVNLHIGNGASLCAVKDSKSIDTSMGLTPLAGVMMGTRSGDIDPSIHQFVVSETKITVAEFTDMLNKKSGLLGVSGISSDVRDLLQARKEGNKDAEFALNLYTQKIADYLINYINKVGKDIDGIVFTGGVGENAALVRNLVLSKINFPKFNIVIDKEINEKPLSDFAEVEKISAPDSDLNVFVIKTNEELLIAQNAAKIFNK